MGFRVGCLALMSMFIQFCSQTFFYRLYNVFKQNAILTAMTSLPVVKLHLCMHHIKGKGSLNASGDIGQSEDIHTCHNDYLKILYLSVTA